jgi:hypothetical protein
VTTLLDDIVWDDIDMESVLANSYKDFHTKGFDYLCLHRDPGLTLKVYFFEDGIQDMSEVVNPHDHRYDFATQCLSGVIRNRWYRGPRQNWAITRDYHLYHTYEWWTPLLGGNGFEYVGTGRLKQVLARDYLPGEGYYMSHHELHTIQVMAPETCIVLAQYEDRVPANQPTYTFTRSSEPPSIDGLYNKFTADQAMKRINIAKELMCRL